MSYHLHPGTACRLAAEAYYVSKQDVLGRSRSGDAVRARQLLMFLLHSECRWSVSAIARRLGRDHSTVSYGLRRYGGRLWEDEEQDRKAYAYVQRELADLASALAATQKESAPPPKGSQVVREGRRAAR